MELAVPAKSAEGWLRKPSPSLKGSERKVPDAITVSLVNWPRKTAWSLAQHAARTCYEAVLPGRGIRKRPNVKGQLLLPGHHTTLEHGSYTFAVEGIAVADITLGFHLTTPYYITDQRSGRYTKDMFNPSGLDRIAAMLGQVYPSLSEVDRAMVRAYTTRCMNTYQRYLPAAIDLAAAWIREDRPKLPEKKVMGMAESYAQEQLRMAIPVIFPTAFYFTVNAVTLASLYRAAWRPGMRVVLEKMVEVLLRKDPSAAFYFEIEMGQTDWEPALESSEAVIQLQPSSLLVSVDECTDQPPSQLDTHPYDLLRIRPEYLGLTTKTILSDEEMSLAIMGQDQRHRSVRRSSPIFTGAVMAPPLVEGVGMAEDLLAIQREWLEYRDILPGSLFSGLAPYGAVVRYRKSSDLTAAIHDLGKRTCNCAQQEHYNKDVQLRADLAKRHPGHMLLQAMVPRCYGGDMKCAEGVRTCGRDIRAQLDPSTDYFGLRRV
jgi:thymidylate synthase ThyX